MILSAWQADKLGKPGAQPVHREVLKRSKQKGLGNINRNPANLPSWPQAWAFLGWALWHPVTALYMQVSG